MFLPSPLQDWVSAPGQDSEARHQERRPSQILVLRVLAEPQVLVGVWVFLA